MTDLRFSQVTSTRCASRCFRSGLLLGLSLSLLGFGPVGCGRQDSPPPRASDEPVEAREEVAEAAEGPAEAGDEPVEAGDEADRRDAALAKLSSEDLELAERQGICPVTEKPLGWMGTPVKITVEGRDVLLCCAGCEDAVREAPEEHFEKLDRD